MEAVSEKAADRRWGFWERLLPLRYWLGAEAAGGSELGQAKTRLICTFVGLCGFGVIGYFSGLPSGIVGIGIVFLLYAVAYLILVRRRPVPTHGSRGFAVVADNLALIYIAYFGGGFAAYVGFLFLVTIGWGLRFGRQYLFLATGIATAGMAGNLVISPYWHDNVLFGGTIIFGLLANAVNASILLGRIAGGNRQLAEKVEEISRLAWQDQLTKLPNRPCRRVPAVSPVIIVEHVIIPFGVNPGPGKGSVGYGGFQKTRGGKIMLSGETGMQGVKRFLNIVNALANSSQLFSACFLPGGLLQKDGHLLQAQQFQVDPESGIITNSHGIYHRLETLKPRSGHSFPLIGFRPGGRFAAE